MYEIHATKDGQPPISKGYNYRPAADKLADALTRLGYRVTVTDTDHANNLHNILYVLDHTDSKTLIDMYNSEPDAAKYPGCYQEKLIRLYVLREITSRKGA